MAKVLYSIGKWYLGIGCGTVAWFVLGVNSHSSITVKDQKTGIENTTTRDNSLIDKFKGGAETGFGWPVFLGGLFYRLARGSLVLSEYKPPFMFHFRDKERTKMGDIDL